MADPFERLFQEYALAFGDFDAEKIASFFDCPCMMVHPDGSASLTTERAILDNMRALLDHHRAQGFGHVSMSNLRAEYQATNLAIVSIRWRLFDRQDQPLWEWWNTYNLIDHGAGWKIAVSTTHAEMPSADPC